MIKGLASLALGNPWVIGSLTALMIGGLAGAYWKGRWDGAALTTASQNGQVERVINGISNMAERARARVRLCADRGMRHDPERGDCVKG